MVPAKRSCRIGGQEAITSLNVEVGRKLQQGIAKAKADGTPLAAVFVASQRPLSAVYSGTPIYFRHAIAPTVVIALLAATALVHGASAIGPFNAAVALAVGFVAYDLFSGVLHVVLDEPKNVDLPFIGQAALEFQWHHLIPSDIARKDFTDVIGDFWLVAPALCVTNFVMAADGGRDKLGLTLMAIKLFAAYFGQYSHRASHDIKCDPVARLFQTVGIMISIKGHKEHHQPPHDSDFCLIGWMNPVISAMRCVTLNRWAWLVVMLSACVYDVKLMCMGLRFALGPIA